MASRLDRLLQLLETGASQAIRLAAAKQVAQIATKCLRTDVGLDDDLKKPVKSEEPAADNQNRAEDWAEVMSVVAKLLPYFRSRNTETRNAAASSLSQICSLAPIWKPLHPGIESPIEADFPHFSVEQLIESGKLLLSSSGQEFTKISLGTPADVERARKEAMTRLGLDFLDDGEDDAANGWTQEIMEEVTVGQVEHETDDKMEVDSPQESHVKSEDVESPISMDTSTMKESSHTSRAPVEGDHLTSDPPEDTSAGLSARERNRLKRKRKTGGGTTFISAAVPPPAKVRVVDRNGDPFPQPVAASPKQEDTDKVIVDPQKGGQVEAKEKASQQALEVKAGHWVWASLVKLLAVDLFNPNWETRHGAALALREIIKNQGVNGGMQYLATADDNALLHAKWCNDIAAKLLCVFVLDRFSDFVSDQVIAPVREGATQTLAALLIHMPAQSVTHVHLSLLQMIRQDFASGKQKKKTGLSYVWQVRHAGLLGLKYEVAVRSDLIQSEDHEFLRGVVEAALLGLGDDDDDVRCVAAACLLPITKPIVTHLLQDLPKLLSVLWSCFESLTDDLASSVSAVMNLLASLISFPQVIEILGDPTRSRSINDLAPLLFPFFRHTIPAVRVSVVQTLSEFLSVKELPRGWIQTPFLRLLFQNILLEEKEDIRALSLQSMRQALSHVAETSSIQNLIPVIVFRDWIESATTPIGQPLDPNHLFLLREDKDNIDGYNVDKNMLHQDLSLLSEEVVWLARLAAAKCLSIFATILPLELHQDYLEIPLKHYLASPSFFHKFMGATILQEWSLEHTSNTNGVSLVSYSALADELSKTTLDFLASSPPSCYHETFPLLEHISITVHSLVASFVNDSKFETTDPGFPRTVFLIEEQGGFTISHARECVDWLDGLHNQKPKKKKDVARIEDGKKSIRELVHAYEEEKDLQDSRVLAAFAAAAIACKTLPSKLTPLIKAVMNGVKLEKNSYLQQRAATAVASFAHLCVDPDSPANLHGAIDKVIKNLSVFLCQEETHTPLFTKHSSKEEGIMSFNKAVATAISQTVVRFKDETQTESKEIGSMMLIRRGGVAAFTELSLRFGPSLFDSLPRVWKCVSEDILLSFPSDSSVEAGDALLFSGQGQPFLDSLTALGDILPTLHQSLFHHISDLFPSLLLGLKSKYSIVRQGVAKCFAVICDVMTPTGMLYIVENVITLLGDPKVLTNRQGAVELIFHVVNTLQFKSLPYVTFLVVPLLGRMSDPDEDIRITATNSFATLVKMVPLEAGLPDPPGFPPSLLEKRDEERKFLRQLLDGSQVEDYHIPVEINAELRKYQQDGVNWLAFLAKYQLHGVLCDDMGLGKTLQSICILASKHHERMQRKEPHLPSFIVCPPTLTNHWYHEIKKYANNLRPVMYGGPVKDRRARLKKIQEADIVITSYDVVRNDISMLGGINWLYCILDEGHLIKNAKSKISQAVKLIKAHHRLILSGTPIQNNLLELWSLFDFLMPGFLGNENSFNERFARPVALSKEGKAGAKGAEAAARALEALHKQVLPFLLRRMKENVLNDLPPKIIQDYYCDVSPLQQLLFEEFQSSKTSEEVSGSVRAGERKGHVFQALQYLRRVCNHPALVLKENQPETQAALQKLHAMTDTQTTVRDIEHAPKLLALRQLLNDCGIGTIAKEVDENSLEDVSAPPQHRCLIFCQMKLMIDVIETDLFQARMPSVSYMRLDGTVDPDRRHAIVQTFNDDPSIDCLLLTTHIGGLGLTLTGADTVIFVEHDWNPMKDLQAMDRAHRLGQKRVVNVYRLITKGTLEEKIMGLQRFKLNIANSVVTQQNSGLDSMDTDLVLDLFRQTTEEEDAATSAKQKQISSNGPVSQKNILDGLEELHGEDEYEGLDLQSFMSSLGR